MSEGSSDYVFGSPETPRQNDADAPKATVVGLLRGILDRLAHGTFAIDQTSPGFSDSVTVKGATVISTVSTTVKRPANATPYAANQAWADSTSAPTAGGFTLPTMARTRAGAGKIVDAVFTCSLGTLLQGELWIFDRPVTAINDGASFSVTAADLLNLVGIVPFNCIDNAGTPTVSYVTGLGNEFNCVNSQDLRFLVKVMNTPTPGNADVLSVRLHVEN